MYRPLRFPQSALFPAAFPEAAGIGFTASAASATTTEAVDFPWLWCLLMVLFGGLSAWLALRALVREACATERRKERERIARDLHDGLLQDVQALILQVDNARFGPPDHLDGSLSAAIEQAEAATMRTREQIEQLRVERPVAHLPAALERLAAQWCGRFNIKAAVTVTGRQRSLAAQVGNAVVHIAHEALANVAMHAHASEVFISLAYNRRALAVTIRDNGQGMPLLAIADGAPGFGLQGMRERAHLVGGELALESGERGTTVTVTVAGRAAYAKR